ncbi:MAG TPA: addiction module protein [Lacipirellulaceae bacterium]|nr:addiction module protein [Lacipirellulaceae bacterium]
MSNYAELFSAASQLPVELRIRLIDELWETVPEGADVELSREWLAEIERRSAEIDAGTAELEDWESVRGRLFKRVNLIRED